MTYTAKEALIGFQTLISIDEIPLNRRLQIISDNVETESQRLTDKQQFIDYSAQVYKNLSERFPDKEETLPLMFDPEELDDEQIPAIYWYLLLCRLVSVLKCRFRLILN